MHFSSNGAKYIVSPRGEGAMEVQFFTGRNHSVTFWGNLS